MRRPFTRVKPILIDVQCLGRPSEVAPLRLVLIVLPIRDGVTTDPDRTGQSGLC